MAMNERVFGISLDERSPTLRSDGHVPQLRSTRSTATREGTVVAIVDVLALVAAASVARSTPAVTLVCVLLPLVTCFLNGTYRRPRLTLSALNCTKATALSASAPLVLVATFDATLGNAPSHHRLPIMVLAALVLGRFISFRIIRELRRHHGSGRPTVIVGSGMIAGRIIERLLADPTYGLTPVGYIDDQSSSHDLGVPLLGNTSYLAATLQRTGARCVVVAFSPTQDMTLITVLREIAPCAVEVLVVPRLFEVGASSGDLRTEECGGTPLVWLPSRAWRPEQLALKRAGDVVMAATALLLAAPIMIAAAVAVRITSPGPVLFRQQRVGRDGTVFEMLKFRSMTHDPAAPTHQGGGGDPRITRVGRTLRRTSIDELPQLFNVLAGQMSMVGPRPELPAFVISTGARIPGYTDRHRVHVGLTGWAQIHRLRGVGTSLEDRALYDNYYIDHWSFWRDVCIVLRTAGVLASGS